MNDGGKDSLEPWRQNEYHVAVYYDGHGWLINFQQRLDEPDQILIHSKLLPAHLTIDGVCDLLDQAFKKAGSRPKNYGEMHVLCQDAINTWRKEVAAEFINPIELAQGRSTCC
ncbi:MAG TPA: hypothetical protein VMQ44_01495 [Candidatus Saccharimonadales bacterium]|nr:hypothetical protein [Candidatus Saccharimonadales bacterium]